MTKSNCFSGLFLSSRVLKGMFTEYFYELPGSIILSAWSVWGL